MSDDSQDPEQLPDIPELKKLKTKEYRELAEAVRGGTLQGRALETAERIVKDAKADLQAITIGAARMKSVSIIKNLEVIIKLQDELARRIDLRQASLGEIATILRLLRDMNNEDIEFIHDLAFGKGEKLALLLQDNRISVNSGGGREIKVQGGEVTPEGAERLRRMMDAVMERMRGDKIIEVGPRRSPDSTNS